VKQYKYFYAKNLNGQNDCIVSNFKIIKAEGSDTVLQKEALECMSAVKKIILLTPLKIIVCTGKFLPTQAMVSDIFRY
jgi:hypothetical protein